MKLKTILYISIGLIAAAAVTLSIIYLPGKKEVNHLNPEFTKYIAAYTSGHISKNSTVKIRLLSNIANRIKSKNAIEDDMFDFSPNIEGECHWLDDQTIEFKPKEPLESDEEYVVEFELGEIIEVPDDLEDFVFDFKTIKQSFDITIDEHKTIDRKTLEWQKAIGKLQLADAEKLKTIKNLMEARQEGNKLSINWIEGDNDKTFYFEIDSIHRKKGASEVTVLYNGEPIDVEKEGNIKFEIPSITDFKFLSAKIVQSPEQYVQLQFSDPLRGNQVLDGLISIKDVYDLRYIIEDNTVKVYPPQRLDGTYAVTLEAGIRNILGYKLKNPDKIALAFEKIKPAVRLAAKGSILPSSKHGLVLPFEAVNLSAVDVQIVKIYENNVVQFLQVNDLNGDDELRRVGKPVVQTTIPLDKTNVVDLGSWNRYTLDLNELIEAEPGAIYRVTFGFRQKHSLYNCGDSETETEEEDNLQAFDEWSTEEEEQSYWDNFNNNYYNYYWDWEHRDDPCHKAYYTKSKYVSQNIIASDIGLIAKRSNSDVIHVFATDIVSTNPLQNIDIEVYSYQNQKLHTIKTNSDGIAGFPKLDEPFFVVAKSGKQRGYLKLNDGNSLSLSRFDISGNAVQKGLKGFIYGERGVWRPGDTLFLTFILEETAQPLPDNHPIIFELKNPQNQIVKRLVEQKNKTNFYTFICHTDVEAPTGNWNATVSVGGVKFHKSLKIETIKPNRLKINFDFGKEYLVTGDAAHAQMQVKWLHGATAKNLDAKIEAVLNPVSTTFPKYSDFVFDDPTKKFYSESEVIFDGKIDENGRATIQASLSTEESAPGKLNATFITKVFETGGNFSIDQYSLPYYPYTSFIGMKTPKGDKARGMLLTDTTHTIELVTLNPEGEKVNESHTIQLEFYKLSWKWWWDQSNNDLANFTSRSHKEPLKKATVTTKNGKATWNIRVNHPDWGRYLVRAHDVTSGHSTAKVVYIDWPGWAGRAQKERGAAAMLTFTADKEKYQTGEQVKLSIPTGAKGRALVSIENGTKVVETHWVETHAGQTEFKFTATKAMTPNVYVNVTLLQPHAQTANDLPIRLYGIVPISVEAPETHLHPEIQMPEVLESEKMVNITVSEKDNKEMTYTLAIVDEGLLDLTRFKTPDPWNSFYAKEALGVKTWDVYDNVIGAYGGKLERILGIGGDDEAPRAAGKKANRFKPVVKFLGPFHLKGGKKTHQVYIPRYIGSVRTMLIAGHENAFGATDKATPVRKPLMVLGTLPRVLGPGETVRLPVTVFAMEKGIKNVAVKINTNHLLTPVSSSSKSIRFDEPGEKTIDFELKVTDKTGIATVEITTNSGRHNAKYDIELDVRNPNPRITDVLSQVITAGNTWDTEFSPVGMQGTNHGVLEVSGIPPINLEQRLKFLMQYPHGCIEQTTSAAFPQLYVSSFIKLGKNTKDKLSSNVKAAIKRLSAFQLYNGGFGYWPNSNNVSEWGTNYAGHFMIEAKDKGYNVSPGLLNKWLKYQKNKARNWIDDGERSQFIQAYRLYTLALAGKPQKGAMNRLRENKHLNNDTKWRLAAAYHLAGKKRIAKQMVSNLSTNVTPYTELSYTFGTATRDKAMILETLCLLGDYASGYPIVKDISEELGSKKWVSTQTTAYSLIAVSKYVENDRGKKMEFVYTLNNGSQKTIKTSQPIAQIEIPVGTQNSTIRVKNFGGKTIYARVILDGIPLPGNEPEDAQNKLNMEVSYQLPDGSPLKPEKIEQGTDFIAVVKVKNPGTMGWYKEMALTQVFPSGWEIINMRMLNIGNFTKGSTPKYQDIRDDRAYTYFDLKRKETKTFKILLNASYMGKFYLPTAYCEAMYDATINARQQGTWVEIVRPGEL